MLGYEHTCLLKAATAGFASVQTICFVLWVDLYRAYTYLYMFCMGSKGIVGFWRYRAHYTTLRAILYDNLACLGQLTVLGSSWPGCYAQQCVFWVVCPGLFIDLLHLRALLVILAPCITLC